MKKTISLLLVLLMVLSVALSGCRQPGALTLATAPAAQPSGSDAPETTAPTEAPAPTETPVPTETPISTETPAPTETPEPTDPTATQAPEPANDEALIRWENGGLRDYRDDVPVDMISFSEMEYVRPDVETLYADFDALIRTADTSADVDALLEDYYAVYDQYLTFYTMDTLANIRHSLDTTDDYYAAEYDWCEAESPNVEEKLETLNKAFGAGPAREELESAYFGEDYFDQYDDYEVYTNETYLSYSKQEKDLLSEYRELTADPDGNIDTDAVTDCYIRLVKVRKKMAKALDYDSYAEYAYDISYHRDYTVEQGEAFIDGIQTYIVPVMGELLNSSVLYSLYIEGASEDDVEEMVESAAKNIGGSVYDAYRFMKQYGLCDIKQDPKKLEGSFETYLYDYEAPFVLINAQGTSGDYTTFAHEFGHFTDGFYNYGANEDLETAETFSQAMELLALNYTDTLGSRKKSRLTKIQLIDLLQAYLTQAAFARFESEVYKLPNKELTPENVNKIFMQVCLDFGLAEEGEEEVYASAWTEILHFFEVPYYVIAYCVSADNALQVYRLETEKQGDGVAAYFRLLDRDHEAGVQQFMEDANLENPFREDGLAESADFLRAQLGLD